MRAGIHFGAVAMFCACFMLHQASCLKLTKLLLTRQHCNKLRRSDYKYLLTRLYSGGANRDGLGKPKGYSDASLRYVMKEHTQSGLPNLSKPFLVLGIESSCDDTGVAVVRSDGSVLSNIVYSQNDIHEKFGGIVPSLAMEAHKQNIDIAVEEALKAAGLDSLNDIDAVAVTKGPGLEICLRVGCRKAQLIAEEYNKPFVTVHHLEAHCMMARLAGATPTLSGEAADCNSASSVDIQPKIPLPHFAPKVEFPFLVLLASGGHTSLLLCEDMGQYTVLGGTLDDALGEAFDKAARLLGLRGASSGGVAIEQFAAEYVANQTTTTTTTAASRSSSSSSATTGRMTVPMRSKQTCDFSYAGLKNQFRLAVTEARAREGWNETEIDRTNAPSGQMEETGDVVTLSDMTTGRLCAEFQTVAFAHVEDRLKRALDYVDRFQVPITSLVVVGGVAANKQLRRQLFALLENRKAAQQQQEQESSSATAAAADLDLIFPPPNLCTDNGVMVAWTGVEKLSRGISDTIAGQEVVPRWPLGTPLSESMDIATAFAKEKKEKKKMSSKNRRR
mmetsp:Transcript_15043/g.25028  ORF Transcript_15043/g.25028 Transcript_15043/m.25028 type:complete len:560 (+) Transcript_15043:96-1775(+)